MNRWIFLGLLGQFLFSLRFIVQWISSERKKESHIPVLFWYFSLAGGTILLVYALYRNDPVFIVGQALGLLVYVRNLMLVYQKRSF